MSNTIRERLYEVAGHMTARFLGEECTTEAHGFCIEAHGQYADKIRAIADELELDQAPAIEVTTLDDATPQFIRPGAAG